MTESVRVEPHIEPPLLSPVPLPRERPVVYRASDPPAPSAALMAAVVPHQGSDVPAPPAAPPAAAAPRRGSDGSQQYSSEATSTARASPGDTATPSPAGAQQPAAAGAQQPTAAGAQQPAAAAATVPSTPLPSQPRPPPSDTVVSTRSSPRDAMQRVMKQYPHGGVRQVNCLFLGRQGNGKSSLINSIYQTVTDSNDNVCEVGYGDQSKTVKYACCAELDFKRLMPLVLFDTKGLSDSNDKSYRDLITSILKGRFKPNHNMNKPRWSDYHHLPNARTMIDVVVFVYAYGTPFPHRLAEAVATAARSCEVAVIPVITHYDQVQDRAALRKDEERCKAAFQTSGVLTLANLNALRADPFTMSLETLALRERQIEFAKMTVVDLISQAMLSGQKHHQAKKLNPKKPIADKCRVM